MHFENLYVMRIIFLSSNSQGPFPFNFRLSHFGMACETLDLIVPQSFCFSFHTKNTPSQDFFYLFPADTDIISCYGNMLHLKQASLSLASSFPPLWYQINFRLHNFFRGQIGYLLTPGATLDFFVSMNFLLSFNSHCISLLYQHFPDYFPWDSISCEWG